MLRAVAWLATRDIHATPRRKLQPKVKVVVYESEADNPGKNHYRNPLQTEETVYELSRSRRNEASFKAKAKRPTTKNKAKRKE